VLALLADGTPRSKKAIVAALADRHPKPILNSRLPSVQVRPLIS